MRTITRVLASLALAAAFAVSAATNINTADAKTLEKLSGIGPAKAQAIVDYRTKNGGFKAIDDIKNVEGVGEKTFEMIKGDITVGK